MSDKDYEWLNQWKWCANWSNHTKSFRVVRDGKTKNGKRYLISMAREILGLKYGDKKQADHKDHNTLDNNRLNLRIVTNQQNHFNRNNPKGYSWNKPRQKYLASIKLNGKRIHLGLFQTTREAHNAYLIAKEKYHKI